MLTCAREEGQAYESSSELMRWGQYRER